MTHVSRQKPGTRIKEWDLGENAEALIEATGESPVMYAWLGTEPKAEHPFNVYHDIQSQAQVLRETFAMNREHIPDLARRLTDREYDGVLVLGLGTSHYAAQTALPSFWSYAGWQGQDLESLESLAFRPPIGDFRKTVALLYSGSGSTVDTLRAAKSFGTLGAHQIALTSVAESPLTEITDETIVCAGGFDTGGSDTFQYTTRVAASVWLALEIGALRHPEARNWGELRERLFVLPTRLDELFDRVGARARVLSQRYRDIRSVFVVGSGPNHALAEEIALKYDEMSHIPAKGMSPGRHLHGALGTTTPDILTVVIAPLGDPNYAALRDVAQVTRMLKSPSIAVISEDDEAVAKEVDDVFRLPETDPVLFPLLAILPGQLLAYFAGVAQGDVNPDCQRADIARHARVWHWLFPKGSH